MQSEQLKVLAPVMTRDVILPNSSKKVSMLMVPVPDSKTLMAIPMSTINNMTGAKDEQQAKDLLNWDNGIGTLDGCDLRFKINQLGCLELLDSEEEDDNHYSNSTKHTKKASNSNKIKQISPGSSLLRDGPDHRRPRASSSSLPPSQQTAPSTTTNTTPLSVTKRIETTTNQDSVVLEKLLPKRQIDELKSEVGNWSVEDVKLFVDGIPGCAGCGHLFESQQICGKSLLYLDQKDLVELVNVKLGPAIKIYNAISLIKSNS